MFDKWRLPSVAVLSGILTIAAAQPARAQSINLVPNVGVYIPTTELMKAVNGDEFEQQISLTVGGQLDVRLGSRLGIQGTGSYAPSSLRFSASGIAGQENANIFTGSGRVLVFLVPESSPISFLLTGGVAVINRSGEAYADLTDKTDIGGAVGASVGFRLGPVVKLRVTADSFIYNTDIFDPTGDPSLAEAIMQRDLQLSFGFGIPLLGLGAG